MKQEVYRAVRQYLEQRKDRIKEDLFTLVSVPSVKASPCGGAPFGVACREGLDAAVQLFAEAGFQAEVIDGKYGLATYGNGDSDIGIFAHTDVVGVGDDWKYTAPFSPVQIGDTLVGRGVEDNKAGVVCALYLLKAVRALNIPMKHRLVVFLGADEESGMEDVEAFVREQPMPAMSFVPDNDYPVCIGEKSITRLWLKAVSPLRQVRMEGGFAFNVIVDRVKVYVRGGADVEQALRQATESNAAFAVSREGEEVLLTVTGRTSHASLPDGAINAAFLACDLLRDCACICPEDRAILAGAAEALSDCHGGTLGIGVEDPVFGKLTVACGMVRCEEEHLAISLDIRYGAREDDDALLAALREKAAALGFAPEVAEVDKGTLVDPALPVVSALNEVYCTVTGNAAAKPYLSGGGTYARKLRNAFSVGLSTKKADLDLPAGHGGAHQSDEVISFSGLVEGMILNTMLVLEGDGFAD